MKNTGMLFREMDFHQVSGLFHSSHHFLKSLWFAGNQRQEEPMMRFVVAYLLSSIRLQGTRMEDT